MSRGQEFRWLVLVAFDKRKKEWQSHWDMGWVGLTLRWPSTFYFVVLPISEAPAAPICSLKTDDSDSSQGHR